LSLAFVSFFSGDDEMSRFLFAGNSDLRSCGKGSLLGGHRRHRRAQARFTLTVRDNVRVRESLSRAIFAGFLCAFFFFREREDVSRVSVATTN
jgi:hypothetical protein